MERALGVVVLLGGCQLYVPIFAMVSCYSLSNSTFKVEGNKAESGKTGYVDFKRVVWHDSFRKLLASIRDPSKIGYSIECADGITRHIYPAILILSADYEEQ